MVSVSVRSETEFPFLDPEKVWTMVLRRLRVSMRRNGALPHLRIVKFIRIRPAQVSAVRSGLPTRIGVHVLLTAPASDRSL
jgi:hypothetical protein